MSIYMLLNIFLLNIFLFIQPIDNAFLSYPNASNNVGDGPEGPEARTIADKLYQVLQDKYFYSYNLTDRHKISGLENLSLYGKLIKIYSYGKKVIFHINNNKSSNSFYIITSLGMTGQFKYKQSKHTRLSFTFANYRKQGILNIYDNMLTIYYDDVRLMGNMKVIMDDQYDNFLASLGPDLLQCALTKAIDIDKWQSIFLNKRYANKHICQVLMDQEIIAGIGNYLKSEILYYAGILPQRLLSSLTYEEINKLREVSHAIIKLSYQCGGHTIESYISPDGVPGTYPAAIYYKDRDSFGHEVKRGTTKDTRTSYWVEEIQK